MTVRAFFSSRFAALLALGILVAPATSFAFGSSDENEAGSNTGNEQVNQLIDSLHMTDEHREGVLAACAAAPERSIVVIHGTDTMAETARVVGRAELAKTVVFTGAMIPYSVQGSDALFNLGFALAMAQSMPPGTYVAMNGRAFAWNAVRKDRQSGQFEAAP